MQDDGSKELEIVEVAHQLCRSFLDLALPVVSAERSRSIPVWSQTIRTKPDSRYFCSIGGNGMHQSSPSEPKQLEGASKSRSGPVRTIPDGLIQR